MSVFECIHRWFRRRRYYVGQHLARFIAFDVRREVEVMDTSRIDEGFITAKVRTVNLLYVSKGLVEAPEFESPREIAIAELWQWSGKPWGGMPDGTSLVASKRDEGIG